MDPWLLSFTKLADRRTAIGSSTRCRLYIPGPALNSLPGHREGPAPALWAAAMEKSLRPKLAPYSKSELGEFFSPSWPLAPRSFIHPFIHG